MQLSDSVISCFPCLFVTVPDFAFSLLSALTSQYTACAQAVYCKIRDLPYNITDGSSAYALLKSPSAWRRILNVEKAI